MNEKTPKQKPAPAKGSSKQPVHGDMIDTNFPEATDDCSEQGYPFIASGDRVSGVVVVSARVVYRDENGVVQQIRGTVLERADYQPNTADPPKLAAYPYHDLLHADPTDYGADDYWAVVFPTLVENAFLPENHPLILIITGVTANGTTELVYPFVHND